MLLRAITVFTVHVSRCSLLRLLLLGSGLWVTSLETQRREHVLQNIRLQRHDLQKYRTTDFKLSTPSSPKLRLEPQKHDRDHQFVIRLSADAGKMPHNRTSCNLQVYIQCIHVERMYSTIIYIATFHGLPGCCMRRASSRSPGSSESRSPIKLQHNLIH